MKLVRAGALGLAAGVVLGVALCGSDASAQSESATAEDGKPASEAPAETSTAPDVPLGANLTPPLGALPPGPALISSSGTGQPGSSSVSMAPGTLTAGTAREGVNAVRAPEAEPAPAPEAEPARAPAPVTETAPEPVADATVTDTGETVVADAAVATQADRDGDNFADELEWDLGLDPDDADTDDDGVADGDELNIYGTSPTVFDTDEDGASDGEELFWLLTDPLVWDDFTAASGSDSGALESSETVETSE